MVATRARADELPDLSVDLHAHLFQKPGLGWFFSGSFGEELVADSWDDRLSSKANHKTLDESGVGIMVVALFAHPVYRSDVRDALREQIAVAKAFAAKSPVWEIAKSPEETEKLLRAGKRALIFSLEGAGGALESEEDLKELIDEEGIRIVTPLHLVDDRFGGAATLNGFQYLANPLNLVDQLLDAHCDHGIETNRQGLTPLGKRLAAELVKRGVWLDLTHASDEALQSLVPIAERAGQPLLFTHTTLRAYRPTERALSEAMLQRVAKSRGILGLLPSDDALETITTNPAFCPSGCSVEACQKGIHAFATMYERVGSAIGFDRVMLGSDFNGGMRHLSKSCGTKSELDREPGYFNLGQSDVLWSELKALGASVPPMRMTARAFLDAWAEVKPATGDEADLPALPKRDDVEGPGWMLTLGTGLSTTPNGEMPAVVLQLDSRFSKDTALPAQLEPIIYFAHLDMDAALSPDEEDVPYANIGLSVVGVRAAWLDNHAQIEAGHGELQRNVALDQRYAVTASALSGRVRTMPGLLKAPGQFNLFIELGIDLLGYDYLRHRSARPDLHGVFLAGGDLGLGMSFYPGEGLISLQGMLGADVSAITSLPVDGFVYQSDIAAGGSLILGTANGRFRQQTSLMRYLNVESDLAAPHDDTQVRGTFAVSF
jgi:microsomal dipeptidase-like Zn-dependent dipeptidase